MTGRERIATVNAAAKYVGYLNADRFPRPDVIEPHQSLTVPSATVVRQFDVATNGGQELTNLIHVLNQQASFHSEATQTTLARIDAFLKNR